MNQKSVIILLLVGIAAIFLAVLAFGDSDGALNFGEPVTQEKGVTSPEEVRPQAKIDVRAACESSLMYTSFENGAAAEAYMAECVEGKHPDVIQRYIDEMGLDGAMI